MELYNDVMLGRTSIWKFNLVDFKDHVVGFIKEGMQ